LLPVFYPWQPVTVEQQTGVRGQLFSAQSLAGELDLRWMDDLERFVGAKR
jgi:hypothetical protein